MKTALRRDEIAEILKRGKRITGGAVMLICGKKKKEGRRERYAVIVPKKNLKRSVDRNRIKRIVREIIRKDGMPFGSFIIRYTGKKQTYQEIQKDMDAVREKVGYTEYH